ncbi:GNAT family N-acetyltransferase [Sphingobium sp. SYK-6]|uniref:GNAT family N-acetyltransferase n=1 Tax=Sphingobium sp. (strain NBRC 103272 / SYK-6) TaxID=627192 RepID=UPI0011D2761E|nr:GNAT family N-acetyltransferase [Sphingobium sp. SYK-6]
MNVGHAPIQPRTPPAQVAGASGGEDATCPLEQDATEPNPFYLPQLLEPARRSLDPHGTVRLIDARDEGGELIARLPVTGANRHGRFPLRHTTNWLHRHCFYGAPLLRRGREEEGWRLLLAQLDAAPWSGPLLHLRALDPDGAAATALRLVCAREGRRCEELNRHERALLRSEAGAQDYWTVNVRAKKRKELRRLQSRLAEMGTIVHRHLTSGDALEAWIDDFLQLEARGWKGAEGTALASCAEDALFLREICRNAHAAGMLDMLRIDCDGRPIAMLVNFVGPQGGFSFKIAIDPDFARYSPGVLIEQDNLARVLDDHVTPWMDSCAAPDHPMIDSLWGERRAIAQYRIGLRKGGLAGLAGALSLPAMTLLETAYARMKSGARS